VFEAIKRGISIDEIHDITMIDKWFLSKLKNLADVESMLADGKLTSKKYEIAKQFSYLDSTIERISGQEIPQKRTAVFKTVDTCAADLQHKRHISTQHSMRRTRAKQFIESTEF